VLVKALGGVGFFAAALGLPFAPGSDGGASFPHPTNATAAIKTGDRIIVDGNTGKVEIIR
jgi:hypothetical protein